MHLQAGEASGLSLIAGGFSEIPSDHSKGSGITVLEGAGEQKP